MDPARRKFWMQALAWTLTVIAGLLVWWANGDDGSGQAPSRLTNQTIVATQTPPDGASEPTDAEPTDAEPTDGEFGVDPVSGLDWVSTADLPPEVLDTLDEIDAGPPYPYDRDGVTFENREGLLPDFEVGYYQEFTVETPGSGDRGARRLVWGLGDEFYYTDDHYESFVRVDP